MVVRWCGPTAVVSNSILIGNWADEVGGGAYGGALYNCTVEGNSALNTHPTELTSRWGFENASVRTCRKNRLNNQMRASL
jgi:hypothetical protein